MPSSCDTSLPVTPRATERWTENTGQIPVLSPSTPLPREDMHSGCREGHAGGFTQPSRFPGPQSDLGHQTPLWQFLMSPTLGGRDLAQGWGWGLPALTVCSSGQGPS